MRETLLARLANRFILCPTTHPIEVQDKTRHTIPVGDDRVEVWMHEVGPVDRAVDVFVLKLAGTGGRAECATDQPACFWPEVRAQIWAFNPPGYGSSTGRASLKKLAPAARAVFEHLQQHAGDCPIVLASNSLGGASALHVAARYRVDGLILRNPPQLPELIIDRFAWRSLYFGAWLIAREVPAELDCCANARQVTAPAVFVMSASDSVVPPGNQRLIHDAYGGPKKIVVLHDAEHATPMTETQVDQYVQSLQWLCSLVRHTPTPCEASFDQ